MYLNVIQLNAGAGSKNNEIPLRFGSREHAQNFFKTHTSSKQRMENIVYRPEEYKQYDTFGFKDMRCISCSVLDSRPEQHLEQHSVIPL